MLGLLLTACHTKLPIPKAIELEVPPSQAPLTRVEGIDMDYVKLIDINPETVPEVPLHFKAAVGKSLIEKTKDGYLCTISELKATKNVTGSEMTPKVVQLDEKGNILWQKSYPYPTMTGTINHLLVLSDGSFIFSVQTYPVSGAVEVIEKSFLMKCDAAGKELWKTNLEDYSGNLLNGLFLTPEGEIIAIGVWRSEDGEQTASHNLADDIVMTKFDQQGKMLNQKGFGGGDFESLYGSVYDPDFGIVISGMSQSTEGDFANENSVQYGRDFIACIDGNLNIKWVFNCEDKESVYDQLVISKGHIYTLLNAFSGQANSSTLLELDQSGQIILKEDHLLKGQWSNVITVLKNEDIIIGAGQFNKGTIAIIKKNGSDKEFLNDLEFSPNIILPTEDGGFMVASHRIIKTAPQPAYISSIWYDTELLVVKYDKDHAIEWQKTYDAYKDVLQQDFIKLFEDGKVLVEAK